MVKEKTLWSEEEMDNSLYVSEGFNEKVLRDSCPSKEVVTLTMVSSKEHKECVTYFKQEIGEYEWGNIYSFLQNWLKNKDIVLKSAKGEIVTNKVVDKFLSNPKQMKKNDQCAFIAIFFSDNDNIKLMIDQCPKEVKDVLLDLLDAFYLSADELYKKKAGKILLKKNRDWVYERYTMLFPWFSLYNEYIPEGKYSKSQATYICIRQDLYHFFLQTYGQELALTRGEPSEEEGLTVLRTEASVVNYYPIFFNLYDQEILVAGKNDRVLVSTIRKCSKMVELDEFFASSEDLNLKNLRASFVFTSFYEMFRMHGDKKLLPVQELIKEYLYNFLYEGSLLPLLMSHLKGSGTKYISQDYILAINDMLEVLSMVPEPDQWISVRGLFYQMLKKEGRFSHLHVLDFFTFNTVSVNLWNIRHGEEYVCLDHVQEEIFNPFVKGVLAGLAAIGILDVAYRDYSEKDRSWVDWLEFVRFTDLGKYIFGFTKTYESKLVNKPESYFSLEPDRLILRSLEKNNPFTSFLEDVATPIGNCRYVFSYESFLKNSIYKKDVQHKVDFFKQFVCKDLPPVWANFLEKLKGRCHPMESVSNQNFSIFKLNPENKELLHLLSTEPKLKELVIRAEGYMILVENKNKDKFARRLKTLGFML